MSHGKRILVVEDDDPIREALIELLGEYGYEPVGAANGREALDTLRLQQAAELPCLILLDLMMPEMDGREFRREQLKAPTFADIPVVVLSAYRDISNDLRDMKVGDFLKKPVRFPDLLQIVRRHCAQN